jgi:hypothetical protein
MVVIVIEKLSGSLLVGSFDGRSGRVNGLSGCPRRPGRLVWRYTVSGWWVFNNVESFFDSASFAIHVPETNEKNCRNQS